MLNHFSISKLNQLMSVKAKYQPVLDLGEKFEVKDGYVEEVDGKLKIGGTTKTQYHKNLMWDKIKEIGGEAPSDLQADIKVENTDYYHKHTVQSGESLSKIAKHYYGDASKYMHIFNANTDQLKDPNLIHPNQELTIPFPE
jgi:nucleoid-associated protein YgaU